MEKKQQVFLSRLIILFSMSVSWEYKETSLFGFSDMNMILFLFIYTMQPQEFRDKGLLNVFTLEVRLGASYYVFFFSEFDPINRKPLK